MRPRGFMGALSAVLQTARVTAPQRDPRSLAFFHYGRLLTAPGSPPVILQSKDEAQASFKIRSSPVDPNRTVITIPGNFMANASRKASPAAKKNNPALKRVKG